MDATNVLMYFVVVILLFQLLAKHIVQLLYHVSDLLTNVHHTQTVSFAIIKLFLLFNTTAKTNHIDSTSPLHYL